jgi:YD repeat-containing protein
MLPRRNFTARLIAMTCGAALLGAGRRALADTVSYTYDALGRVWIVTYSNGATITYAYDAAGNRTTLSQTPPGSVQATLIASPPSIVQGQQSTLGWTTNNATSAAISAGVGTVAPTAGGSISVSPSSTTTYTITAQGPFGPATSQATVTVLPPPSCTLSASPGTIALGSSTTLSWTSANASSASINNGVGNVTPVGGGSVVVTPGATTTYTLTVVGALGSQATQQVTVTVNAAGFNQTLQITGSGPVNLRTLANNAGYTGNTNANIVFEVGNGVTLTGGSNGGIAIDTGTWPGAPFSISLALVVKTGGVVRGGGGNGGAGGSSPVAGGSGGDAIHCRHPITITIDSGAQVRGGGGGGGGGSSVFEGSPEPEYRPGGGGGGGAPNGIGGVGDSGAGNGGNGTLTSGGVGGSGASGGVNGGAGGGYGAIGSNGQGWFSPSAPGGAGGVAGYCIRKNGHNVPVTNNGSTSGTIG